MVTKRKGVAARWGLKEARSKRTSRCPDLRHTVQDELANDNDSPATDEGPNGPRKGLMGAVSKQRDS